MPVAAYAPTHHVDILCSLGPMPSAEEWAEKGLDKYGLIAVNASGEAAQVCVWVKVCVCGGGMWKGRRTGGIHTYAPLIIEPTHPPQPTTIHTIPTGGEGLPRDGPRAAGVLRGGDPGGCVVYMYIRIYKIYLCIYVFVFIHSPLWPVPVRASVTNE